MEYPFDTKIEYFKPDELKNINEFIKFMPHPKHIYENADGEKRQVLIVRLPRGCVTELTVYDRDTDNRYYHTPIATHNEPWAVLAYFNPATPDEVESCTSMEWLEWIGESHKEEVAKTKMSPVDAAITRQSKNMARALSTAGMPTDAKDLTEEEKTKWRPNRKKRK